MDGFLNLLKPPGMTSSDLVYLVRRALPRGVKVGHGGTLDPDAAGVLPICVGRATRLFDYIVDKRKEYLAEMRLGIVTDTQDATGRVLARHPSRPQDPEAAVRQAARALVGRILQVPPVFSALKRGGVPLYELARRPGARVEPPAPREALVYALDYLYKSGPDRYMLRVECGRGVYIRTLLHDLGTALGCGAHMSFLLRTRAGAFDIARAATREEFEALGPRALLLPMDAPLSHLPRLEVEASRLAAVLNGNPLAPDWYRGEAPAAGEAARLYAGDGLIGIGEARANGEVRVRAMLAGGNA